MLLSQSKIIALSLFILLSCSTEEKNNSSQNPDDTQPIQLDLSGNTIPELIQKNLDYLQHVSCRGRSNDCQLQDVKFSDGKQTKGHDDEVILVSDSISPFLTNIRYRHRVIANYKFNNNGNLVENDSTYRTKKYVINVMDSIAKHPDFVSAIHLKPLQSSLNKDELLGNLEHGNTIFAFLAEHNPNAKFVVLQDGDLLNLSADGEVCRKDFNALAQKATKMGVDLHDKLLLKHKVSFVNYSIGYSAQDIRKVFLDYCKLTATDDDIVKYMNAIKPYHDVLFNTPGVLTLQAAGYSLEAFDLHYKDRSFKNRMRVSCFNSIYSGLNHLGIKTDPTGKTNLSIACDGMVPETDLFLNFGSEYKDENYNPFEIVKGKTPYNNSHNGLNYSPINDFSTSWITPLATSYAVFLKNTEFKNEKMSDELITKLKDRMTPKLCPEQDQSLCKYQDPLLTKQLEVFRLKYLP